jgi:hypothetical protein
MLRQDEVAFFKVLSTMDFSPALLKKLRKAVTSRKKNGAKVAAGNSSTTSGGRSIASQRSSVQLVGKRQA